MAPNKKARTLIAKNSIDRSPAIVAEHKHQGASVDSVFIRSQLAGESKTTVTNMQSIKRGWSALKEISRSASKE
jgi:hypothetical protein